MTTYTLTVGIHGTDHPMEYPSLTQRQLDEVLEDYRRGKTRVIESLDVTRAHITYMSRRENDA